MRWHFTCSPYTGAKAQPLVAGTLQRATELAQPTTRDVTCMAASEVPATRQRPAMRQPRSLVLASQGLFGQSNWRRRGARTEAVAHLS